MAEVMYQLAFIQIMLKNISKDFNLKSIIRKTRRSRFQNEAFRFLGLFPKRSVSFFTKFERHSDGLPIQFERRFFIAFCGEKVSARIAGLAFFLYLYIVVRMGHYSLLSYVE